MITEDYVSFEVAKLLKEKGFAMRCMGRYTVRSGEFHLDCTKMCNNGGLFECAAPTHSMAMRWLRKKGIYITIVYGDYPSLNKIFWTPQIDSLEGFDLPDSFYKEHDEYEQAVEAALKYSLEKLI